MRKVSIIVPCFNAAPYIAQCLESIVRQSYQNLEIICINDGSTDNSLSVITKYANFDPRILIIDQVNKGISESRNTGLLNSTGDFIMFIDADDWLHDNTINILFNKYSGEDLIVFSYYREFNKGRTPKILRLEGIKNAKEIQRKLVGPIGEEMRNIDSIDALAPVWGKVYRREIFPALLQFKDLKIIGTWEDGFFNVEILNHCSSILIIDQPLYHYRKYNNSSYTYLYKVNLHEKWINKFQLLRQYLFQEEKSPKFILALNNRICITFLGLCLNEIRSGKSFKKVYKKIQMILRHDLYTDAFIQFDVSFLSIHWKIFYYFCKIKCVWGILILSYAIHFLINRKN